MVLSTRPGYIEYMQRPREDIGKVRELVKRIDEKEREVEQVQREIDDTQRKKRKHSEGSKTIGSFSEWFAENGRPKVAQKGLVSAFKPSKHYLRHWGVGDDGKVVPEDTVQKKSQAIAMITGRLI